MSLISSLRRELHARKGEWPRIAVGAGCSYSWLCKFAQGQMNNPGVRRLEALEQFLIEHPKTATAEKPNPHAITLHPGESVSTPDITVKCEDKPKGG